MCVGILRFALLRLLVCVVFFSASVGAAEEKRDEKALQNSTGILVLNSYHDSFPRHKVIDHITKTSFRAEHAVDLTFFKLDISHSRDLSDWIPAYNLLRQQIRSGVYKIIITCDDATLDFLLMWAEDLRAGNVSIVSIGYEKNVDGLKTIYPNLVVVSQETDILYMVESGAKLFGPDSKAIILSDDSPEGRIQMQRARGILANYCEIDIEFIDGRQYSNSLEIFKELRRQPPKTFVVFTPWRMLRSDPYNARSAFFTAFNRYVGLPYMCSTDFVELPGCIGGSIAATSKHAALAMDIVRRILAGESAANIPNVRGPLSPVFNYPALAANGLDPDLLLPGVKLLNQPRAFGGVSLHVFLAVTGTILLLLASLGISFWLFLKNRRAKRRSRAILKMIPVQILACDRSGNFLYKHLGNASEKLRALFGPAVNVFDDVFDETAKAGKKALLDRLWSEGRVENVQFQHGDEIFNCNYQKVGKELFGVEAALWASLNITEVEMLRRQYRRDLNMMQHITKASKVTFFTINSANALHFVTETVGWPLRDGVPAPLEELPVPADIPLFEEQMRLLREGKKSEAHFEFRSAIGTNIQHFDLLLIASDDGSNEISGCLKDLSENKKNELLLDYSARLKKLVFDLVSVAFFAKDLTDGSKYIEVNDYFCTYAKVSREEIIGKTNEELPVRFNAEEIRAQEKMIMRDGSVSESVGSVLDRDGVRHYYKSHKVVFVNPENNHLILLGVLLDIGELQEKQRRLELAMQAAEEAARAKSMFLATMSHEIRTPLNAVIGFSELMQFPNVSMDQQNSYAGSINMAGNTLLRLINDVLDLSKLEAGQMQIAPVKCDIAAVLREIFAIFTGMTSAKNLDFTCECSEDIPWLFLDDLRLRQILLNLIGNACKFTAKGFIRVEVIFDPVDKECGTLTIRVRDSGAGIAEDCLRKVFDPFWQETRVRAPNSPAGTGIGLAISRRLVERMNGTLSLESKLNCGSTFTICIRDVRYETNVCNAKAEADVKTDLECPAIRRKALLVDDIPINVKVLQALLNKLNVECVTTTLPAEAIRMALDEKPDFVLTDLWMPGMNGDVLAEKMHAIPELEKMPIFLLTADVEAKSKTDMRNLAGIVLKPVTLKSLKSVLEGLPDPEDG